MALFVNFWSHAPTLKANTLKAENLAILVIKIEVPYLWNKDILGAGLPTGFPVFFWVKRLSYRNSLPRGNEA